MASKSSLTSAAAAAAAAAGPAAGPARPRDPAPLQAGDKHLLALSQLITSSWTHPDCLDELFMPTSPSWGAAEDPRVVPAAPNNNPRAQHITSFLIEPPAGPAGPAGSDSGGGVAVVSAPPGYQPAAQCFVLPAAPSARGAVPQQQRQQAQQQQAQAQPVAVLSGGRGPSFGLTIMTAEYCNTLCQQEDGALAGQQQQQQQQQQEQEQEQQQERRGRHEASSLQQQEGAGPQAPGVATEGRRGPGAGMPVSASAGGSDAQREAPDAGDSGSALASDGTPSNAAIKVSVGMHLRTSPGERLWLLGSAACLGGWDSAKAVRMRWSEGHVWRTSFELPAGCSSIQYKALKSTADGVMKWEGGSNRVASLEASSGEVSLQHVFGQP